MGHAAKYGNFVPDFFSSQRLAKRADASNELQQWVKVAFLLAARVAQQLDVPACTASGARPASNEHDCQSEPHADSGSSLGA